MNQIRHFYTLLFLASFMYALVLEHSGLFFATLFFTNILALTSIFHAGGKKEMSIKVKLFEFWFKVLIVIFLGCASGELASRVS